MEALIFCGFVVLLVIHGNTIVSQTEHEIMLEELEDRLDTAEKAVVQLQEYVIRTLEERRPHYTDVGQYRLYRN